MLIEREYKYKPKWWIILAGGAFFGFGAVISIQDALSKDRIPTRIDIYVAEPGATIILWIFTFLCLCFVLAVIILTIHRLKFRQRIAFTDSEIIIPASFWTANEKSIGYETILGVSVRRIKRQKVLTIVHSDGEFVVNSLMLPSSKDFEEIVELLKKKRKESRSKK